ncbi:PREDICTED: uncharacterized protein LOC105366638 [Ceratosolen solmsi marchali]|uniref:Uncharacterized protein LOC105366638 n=1 Tax=Ceratosolen solmsi marchali TaxID=326594 RepID=A0AAJ7E0R7_9HYME|nr:PREDICTED: uncharacterized protein LOC105366638 [Ceratosolen solmsi marchali]
MEGGDGPSAISINPNTIKAAQEEMGRLDVLVCGQCHSVFHFIDEFQEHRSKEGACSKLSHFRENSNNEQKAQVWAFLLWKDTQIQQDSPDKDTVNSWKLYQKWCKMETHVRDCWIMAGKTIQTFTKISNTKMQDIPRQQGNITTEGNKTIVVRKVIRNGQPESSDKKEFKAEARLKSEPAENKDKIKLKPSIKPKGKLNIIGETNAETSDEEYIVEKILAKRFNPKKKVYEYLLKWEGYAHEHNTWEEVAQVSMTCKQLMEEFEKNLAKQKELKAQQVAKSINRANQLGLGQKIFKIDNVKAGPSTATQAGRPMRSSKSKAMDQVKQWCGSMKEEDNDLLGKRKIAFSDSDSDDDGISGIGSIKRSKIETSGDDDWTADSDEDKVIIGRSDVIQRAFNRANVQSNGSNRSNVPMTGTDLTNNMIANNKNIVKIDTKQSSNIQQQGQSNMYIVHRKDGIIKLDSSPTNKISVKGPSQSVGNSVLMLQNRDGISNVTRKQVISSNSHVNSITPVKVISKPDGTQVVTQMKVVPKGSPSKLGAAVPKNEPIKIQPKPEPNQLQQIHLVTTIPSPLGLQSQRMTSNIRTSGRGLDGRPLLPRPAALRAAVPNSPGIMSITQTRTPVRAPPPRQVAPQALGMQQQRPLLQKRPAIPSTLVQVSSSGVLVNTRPKITVVNQQGKVIQKTLVSPLSKMGTSGKGQSMVTPQQKMLIARRKVAEQAGMLPKLGARSGSGAGRGGGTRLRGRPIENTRPKESKLVESDGLHMEFHELESESSSEEEPDFPPVSTEPTQSTEPDSPPRQFTLCPLTGRIIGPDGEPVEQQPDAEPVPVVSTSTPMAIVQVAGVEGGTVAASEEAELVLPNLEALAESPDGGVMRVEMSPGGTTGTILQTGDNAVVGLQSSMVVPGPDLPCLDDPLVEVQNSSEAVTTITDTNVSVPEDEPRPEMQVIPVTVSKEDQNVAATVTANVKMEEGGSLVTITGDDGVVYQVTGHAEDGQTLLVTRGADGEQQCVYVTTSEQQCEEGSVLTLDHAVAEAVAQLMPDQVNLAPQFYVKEATESELEGATSVGTENQQMVMSVMDNTNTVVASGQEDGENQAQVVAQVIQADEPTPSGTRRVVLLLPDGNLMMTEVDEEQYAALELDK